MQINHNIHSIHPDAETGLYLIEIVCTGNNESPLVEAVGNHLLRQYKLNNLMGFISSGTRADLKYLSDMPFEKTRFILQEAGKKSGFVSDDFEISKFRFEHSKEYRSSALSYAKTFFINVLRPLETAMSNIALLEAGIEPPSERYKQTIANERALLILGVQINHAKEVSKIYSNSKGIYYVPEITTLAGYAGTLIDLEDNLGSSTPRPYQKSVQELEFILPIIIEKFIEKTNFRTNKGS
jgi:hypothetical protein